jgi:hypothetical protein
MKNKYIKYLFNKYTSVRWNIGFVSFNTKTILQNDKLNISWMKHNYKDRWFADPFILRITDTDIILLVEEFYEPVQKGRIAKLVIDKNSFELKENKVVLDLDSHLSFPAILKKGNNVYFYPENSVIGKLILYKYNEEDNTVEPISVLSNEPLTDAVITTAFSKPYMLSTQKPYPNKNILNIYVSREWDGLYELDHTVYFKDNSARNAGEPFQINNKWIRPAQDCNGIYGKGIVLQELVFKDDKFSFNEIKRFYPNTEKWSAGMHTFNVHESIAVVDAKKYKRVFIAKILMFIIKLYGKKNGKKNS